MSERKSEAEIPPLISDPTELAQREASNALAQFDWAMQEVERWIKVDSPTLKMSTLLKLHRIALDGIDPYAGNFRPASVAIKGSNHAPVAGDDVPRYVEEMLDYINENWREKTAIHLSAYVMWRLNWIHPFADGNGRTSRILSYMILCGSLKQVLPGTRTIPEQISENKQPYYGALERADAFFKKGHTNVGEMEKLLEGYLATQLLRVHEQAVGSNRSVLAGQDIQTRSLGARIVAAIESKPVFYPLIAAILLGILGIALGR